MTQNGSTLKVGDSVVIFDDNVRHYENGRTVYRDKFVAKTIVGETSQSWVLVTGRKINKKTMQGTYSPEDIERAVWVHEHRHWIAEAVRRVVFSGIAYEGENYAKLKAIAELIGYDDTVAH